MSDESPNPEKLKSIRWWPLRWIVALAVGVQIIIPLLNHPSVQQRNIQQAIAGIVSVIVVGVWFFALSRVAGKVRLLAAMGVVFLGAVAYGLFSYEGTSGDLVPQFRWRWSKVGVKRLKAQEAQATAIPVPEGAANFPQFLGPNRNGKLEGPALARDWEKDPPKELWRQEVGQAWSGFAVVGGIAVTQEQREDQELVVAYELLTGRIIWSHEDPARYDNPLGGVGPRATPTIVDGNVYTLGGTGILNCLQLSTGKLLWSKDIIKSHNSTVPEWGASGSPLVVGQTVIVAPGQPQGATLAAYHRVEGTRLWIGGNQSASYSSPILANVEGVDQVVYLGPKALAGFDPASGKSLWESPWFPESAYPHVMSPIPLYTNAFLVSSGYGQGSGLATVARIPDGTWQATAVWQNKRMKAKFTNFIEYKGLIYGLDDGVFACFDPDPKKEGEQLWKDGKYGHGQILLVGNVILIMAENGSVVLVDPSREGLREITKMPALEHKTWNPPTLAGSYLLVRNDREAVCYRMPLAK